MTTALQHAFAQAAKLSEAEQEVLATRLLAELEAENEFDRKVANTSHHLAEMAREALAEHRRGESEALNPESP